MTTERPTTGGMARAWLGRAGLDEIREAPARKRRLTWMLRILVLLLVAWGLSRHLGRLTVDLDWSRVSVDVPWLLLGAVLYAAGMSLAGLFFHLVLRDLGVRTRTRDALGVWWVSQVGKYVPGKMMVVVIRCGLLRERGVSRMTTAIASFYETPAFMAGAALLAAMLLASIPARLFPHRGSFLLAAAAFTLVIGVSIVPPVYRRLAGLLAKPFRADDAPVASPSARALLAAPILLVPAWGMIGGSLIACAHGLSREPISTELWPLLIAAAAVGVVAGFAVVVSPSGIGVREWVLVEALAPTLGEERALAATLALRLLWLVVEVAGGLLCYGWMEAWPGKRRERSASSSQQ